MPTDLRQQILDCVQAQHYRPMKPKDFVRTLGLHEDDKSLVRKTIRKLVAEGVVAYGERHLVYAATKRPVTANDYAANDDADNKFTSTEREGKRFSKRQQERHAHREHAANDAGSALVGRFTRKVSGIGFVRLKSTDPFAESPDVYIPEHATLDAATGDTVAVEIVNERGEPKHEPKWKKFAKNRRSTHAEDDAPRRRGRIVKILERAADRFVGTYFTDRNEGFVNVDANKFSEPLHVGDPSASPARDGDKVVVELTAYPTARRRGEAVIVEVLGEHGVPGVDTLLVIRQYNLPEHFSEPALKAARDAAQNYFKMFPDDAENPKIPQDRFDATNEVILTIDPFDARDFDDAVSITKNDDGSWRLGVHIADVAFFVPQGGEIDRDARDRSTSVYLPDRVIPMLPEVLSNSLASLQPGKLRLAKSVYIDFTPDGIRTNIEIKRSVIKSKKRLNYDEAQEFLETQSSETRREWGDDVADLLLNMAELARLLKSRRIRRGAIELAMPEVKLDLDDDGQVTGAHVYPIREANSVIEECMLAANEAVATFLEDNKVVFLRRVHPVPSLKKMKSFGDFVRSLNLGKFTAEELAENRFTIQKLLNRVKGTPEEYAVSYALLRSMPRAVYVNSDDGHYALASDCYTHFTSPIRRYPDLTIHRLVDQVLAGEKPRGDAKELFRLGEHCSDREDRAENAERDLVQLKLIGYLSERIGMRLAATISGVERYGIFARGTDLPAEGLIRIETLTGDRYRYDRTTHSLIGLREENSLRLGNTVTVEVVSVDFDQRQINFRLVETAKNANPSRSTVNK
ncbi:MAG: ribonuclease R family protein [Thermoguttaceae bacterium]